MGAISTTYDSYVYGVDASSYASSGSSSGGGEFDAILASQMGDEGQTASTASAGAAEQALASYDSGQQAAYALGQEEDSTSEAAYAAAESEESAAAEESAEGEEIVATGGAGWPGDGTYMAEWHPSGMQFYDELTGQWIDDNIPHRINETGDMEYYWEGNWYMDTATRHRMLVEGEYVEVEGEAAEGEASQSASAAYTLEDGGPFATEYYYNADLGQWKIFNFPTRENEDGTREYYWQDQWWSDGWDHDYAAASSGQAAA